MSLRMAAALVLAAAGIGAQLSDRGESKPGMPRGYVCERAVRPPVIDGLLDDPAWQAAPWTEHFVDIEGYVRPLPPFATRAKMLWDDRFFYVGAWLEEPQVWATLSQRDSVIFQDNDFEVFCDPDGDNHNYYEIEINALNTVWDLRLAKPYRDGGPALNEWEIPGLRSVVHVDGTLNDPSDVDRGWSVEMAIPWAALAEFAGRPVPPRHGDQWRMNFSRVEWRTEVAAGHYGKLAGRREDNWVWSPQGVVDMHRPEKWGIVQFSTAAPGEARLRQDPTLPARDLLTSVYYAQRSFREQHRRWARTLEELGWTPPDPAPGESLRLETTPEGWQASTIASATAPPVRVWIRQDSRTWVSD